MRPSDRPHAEGCARSRQDEAHLRSRPQGRRRADDPRIQDLSPLWPEPAPRPGQQRLQNLPELQDLVCRAGGGGLMKVKSRSQLQQAAANIFQDLEKNYRPCEIVYIISELLKTMSLVMLQREEA